MTTVVAIVVGLGVGYFMGMRRTAFAILTGVFLVALVLQSFVLPFITPGPHHIDQRDPGYWLVQPIFLALGLGLTWVGAKVKEKRSHRLSVA